RRAARPRTTRTPGRTAACAATRAPRCPPRRAAVRAPTCRGSTPRGGGPRGRSTTPWRRPPTPRGNRPRPPWTPRQSPASALTRSHPLPGTVADRPCDDAETKTSTFPGGREPGASYVLWSGRPPNGLFPARTSGRTTAPDGFLKAVARFRQPAGPRVLRKPFDTEDHHEPEHRPDRRAGRRDPPRPAACAAGRAGPRPGRRGVRRARHPVEPRHPDATRRGRRGAHRAGRG